MYHVSGTGEMPVPKEPMSVTAPAGSNTTLLIPFRNPLDIPVCADIALTGMTVTLLNTNSIL